jgi:two-component system, sensor histidine kinase and response regulator
MADILIVDDDPGERTLVAKLLSSRGHATRNAENGAQALVLANAQPPDLIILDLTMPVMDGGETLRALRRETTTASIPVVILSARDDDLSLLNALRAGAMVYLCKPPVAEELLAVVERLLVEPTNEATNNN